MTKKPTQSDLIVKALDRIKELEKKLMDIYTAANLGDTYFHREVRTMLKGVLKK